MADSDYAPYARLKDAEEAYDDFLNEIFPEYEIAGLSLLPSRVLANTDPVAYRMGFLDFLDMQQEEE